MCLIKAIISVMVSYIRKQRNVDYNLVDDFINDAVTNSECNNIFKRVLCYIKYENKHFYDTHINYMA